MLISKWHIMKKNELLNLLYVERQRLSEQNSHIGWSIWILIGCIITLSWMLLEHYETSSMKSDQFCWSQIVTLMGDFITVAFALLLIKNYYNDKKNSFHFDRFDKSKLPIFIILAVSRHRLRLCRHVLRHQHLQDGAVLRSSDGGCKCHRAAGRAHEADDECSPLHHSSRDASNQRGESRQVSNIKIRQR